MGDSAAFREAAQVAERPAPRAGSRALSLFGYDLSAQVLLAYGDEPLSTPQLEDAVGPVAESSLRAAVGRFVDCGVLACAGDHGRGRTRATELTPAGRELRRVVRVLGRWLELAPSGRCEFRDPIATLIVRALTSAWDSTLVRTLAEERFTLGELSNGISDCSYPALKRRLAKLRAVGLVGPGADDLRVASYVANEWLRRSIAPLAAAARWEQRHDPGAAEPVQDIDVEAAFLLAMPLLELPAERSGACTLAVGLTREEPDARTRIAAVNVTAEDGRIVVCEPTDRPDPDRWVLGTATEWLEAAQSGDISGLRRGSPRDRLARDIVAALPSILA